MFYKESIIKVICQYCGKEFKVIKSLKNRKFCSRTCYDKSRIVDKVIVVCRNCNKKFEVLPKQKNQKYCSNKCRGIATRGKNSPNFGKHLSIETRKKMGLSKIGENNSSWRGGLVKRKCLQCGKCFQVQAFTIKMGYGKYCSQKCMGKAESGENSSQWLGGISFEPYSVLFNQQLKERVRVRDNFICQLCGVPELECNKRLSTHHMDYNKKNSNMNNLISLCHSCHMKTNFNREYWQEYFKKEHSFVTNP